MKRAAPSSTQGRKAASTRRSTSDLVASSRVGSRSPTGPIRLCIESKVALRQGAGHVDGPNAASCQPPSSRMARTRLGIREAELARAVLGASGQLREDVRRRALRGGHEVGFSAALRQARQASLPPRRTAERRLRKAATGSAKNITPKREIEGVEARRVETVGLGIGLHEFGRGRSPGARPAPAPLRSEAPRYRLRGSEPPRSAAARVRAPAPQPTSRIRRPATGRSRRAAAARTVRAAGRACRRARPSCGPPGRSSSRTARDWRCRVGTFCGLSEGVPEPLSALRPSARGDSSPSRRAGRRRIGASGAPA